MQIAILTMFNSLSTTYSLVNVVESHVNMLLKNKYDVTIFVTEHFKDSNKFGAYLDKKLKWRRIVNSKQGVPFKWYDYTDNNKNIHKSFEQEVKLLSNDFTLKLQGYDICFMHDILFQGWHLHHNVAIRNAQKNLPKLKFYNFIHSAPSLTSDLDEVIYPFDCMYKPMDNCRFIYPTYSGLEAVAKRYNLPIGKCHVVYNTLNIIEDMSKEVQVIHKFFNLLESDILCIYPTRLTPSKKCEKITMFLGQMTKATKKSCKVLFCDFESFDINSEKYKTIIKSNGENFGLSRENVLFTSDLGFNSGLSRQVVFELFQLSNLFINPSYSESFGLTTIEAVSRGNFLVLNENVPALKEVGNNFNAHFVEWDGLAFDDEVSVSYETSEYDYYYSQGKILWDKMNKDTALMAKRKLYKNYNNDWVFYNQLQPLIN